MLIAAVFVMVLCWATSATAQTDDTINVPPAQRALSALMAKDVSLYADTQNAKPAYPSIERAFCSAIPHGPVSGWIGKVVSITPDEYGEYELNEANGFGEGTVPQGSFLKLDVATDSLSHLSRALMLGNFYETSITYQTTKPHAPTVFRAGSSLNKTALALNPGDTVMFSGSFVPFRSPRDCYNAVDAGNYFALFRFSSIRKIGSDVTLK